MLTRDQIDHYQREGYVVPPAFFTPDELDPLRAEAEKILAEPRREVVRADDGEPRVAHAMHRYSEIYDRFLHHPKLLEPAAQLLGEPFYCHQYKIVTKSPFGKNNFPWHVDYATWLAGDGMREPLALSIGSFLEPVSEFNGPVVFIPQSHRSGILEDSKVMWPGKEYATSTLGPKTLEPLIRANGLASPKGPAGTTIIFHCCAIHVSSVNLTPWWRHIVYFSPNPVRNYIRAPDRDEMLAYRDFSALEPDHAYWSRRAIQSRGH